LRDRRGRHPDGGVRSFRSWHDGAVAVIQSVQLFFQEGSSDKVYNAQIVDDAGAYTVRVQWGRRGAGLQEGTKAVRVSRAAAQTAFDRVVREKTGKGYQAITAQIRPAVVAPPVGEGSASRAGGTRRERVGHPAQLLNPIEDGDVDDFLADDAMIAQQKLDGARVLVHVGRELVATNRDGQRTELARHALAGLAYLPPGTIVDGEVLGDAYWLFDVLFFAGDDLRERGYLERWSILDGDLEPALAGDARVLPVAIGGAAKQTLHDRLRRAGVEGMVFKHRDAPYRPGRPASGGTQRKYKFVKTADVVIVENAGNAYRMAVWDGSRLFEVGNVFAGTTNASRADLDARLGRGEHPVAEVRYLYATDDHQLFQPVFVGVRTDKQGPECVRAQLVRTDRGVVT
jgi:bifunctional non-homologous end joining protein LigD